MKKPTKPTTADIDAAVAKRKTINKKVTKVMKSGDLNFLEAQIEKFSEDAKVTFFDVKFTFGYYDNYMWVKREETIEEKRKRVVEALNQQYRNKKAQYDNWAREQKRLAEVEKIKNTQAKNVVISCTCNCQCNSRYISYRGY